MPTPETEAYNAMDPEARVAAFAAWLHGYMNGSSDGRKLNSDSFPIIQKKIINYKASLKNTINIKLFYTAFADFCAALQPDYHSDLYTDANDKFELALMHIDDKTCRQAAEAAFITAGGTDKSWKALNEMLNTLQNNEAYIPDHQKRTAAHMEFINDVCMDVIDLETPITDPILIPQKAMGLFPSIYQYNKAYSEDKINRLNHLKNEMHAFYQNLSKDMKKATKNNKTVHDSIKEFYKTMQDDNTLKNITKPNNIESSANQNTSQNNIQQSNRSYSNNEWINNEPSESRYPPPFGMGVTMGVVTAPSCGTMTALITTTEINGLARDNTYNLTTDGEAYVAAVTLGVFFITLSFFYAHFYRRHTDERPEHPHTQTIRNEVPGNIRAITSSAAVFTTMFTGIFTAKYIDGLTKPIFDENGTKVDYHFTESGNLYIAGLTFGAALVFWCIIPAILNRMGNANQASNENINGTPNERSLLLSQVV